MEKRRILLIDDSEITAELERNLLEARGYEVRAATTMPQFEDLLASFRPDLILTDVHMPEVKGSDICRTLKSEYQTRDIPIVLFSSMDEEELSRVARQVGADGYLSKTSGLQALGQKVDELVESILW